MAATGRAAEALVERLEARRPEIEQAVFERVVSMDDSTAERPKYAMGLKTAVSAALSYGLYALKDPDGGCAPVPVELLAQARRAARNRVSLDVVLRRYVAGHALLDDFIASEAEAAPGLRRPQARRALNAQAFLLDHVIDVVTNEYRNEVAANPQSNPRREVRRVERLLAGEPTDAGCLDYDLSGWHVAAIAMGGATPATLREIAKGLDRRLLCVPREEGILWAWFGSPRRPEIETLKTFVPAGSAPIRLVTGEPAQGLSGWRFSHRQAVAAMPIALRLQRSCVRYSEVAVLASIVGDELLLKSLRDIYLTPLAAERDGGKTSRQTLCAYFAAQRNVSSTASLLQVSRKTVASRLRRIEQRLGRPLHKCAIELEAALNLQAMGDLTDAPGNTGT